MSTALKQEEILDHNEIKPEDKKAAVHSYMTERVVGSFTQKEIDVLRSTIANGTTKEEFALFVQTCVNSGLNPFLNHIHPVVFNGNNGRQLSIQISVEGILSLARRQEGFGGVDVQLVHENDTFKMARKDGYMQVMEHEIGFPRGQVVGGYAIARKEGFPDVVVVMEADEVKHLRSGRNSHIWNNYFSDMFKKHLVKRAAKEQYGIEITEQEPVAEEPSFNDYKKDVTPERSNVVHLSATEAVPEEDIIQEQWVKVHETLDHKGLNQEDLEMVIKDKFNGKAHEDFTASEIAALIKFISFLEPEPVERQEDPKESFSEGPKKMKEEEVVEATFEELIEENPDYILAQPEPTPEPEPEEPDEMEQYQLLFD